MEESVSRAMNSKRQKLFHHIRQSELQWMTSTTYSNYIWDNFFEFSVGTCIFSNHNISIIWSSSFNQLYVQFAVFSRNNHCIKYYLIITSAQF